MNYDKAKIDNTLKICKYRFYGDRGEPVNHKSKCIKIVRKKYKTKHE